VNGKPVASYLHLAVRHCGAAPNSDIAVKQEAWMEENSADRMIDGRTFLFSSFCRQSFCLCAAAGAACSRDRARSRDKPLEIRSNDSAENAALIF